MVERQGRWGTVRSAEPARTAVADVVVRIGQGRITRRRASYLLAAGIIISVAVCFSFYLLMVSIHPPNPFGQPGAPITVKGWIDAYTDWSNTHLFYSQAYAVWLVAAIGFAVAFTASFFPRVVLAASLVILNVYFAWTSHLVSDISHPLANGLTQFVTWQDNSLLTVTNLHYLVGDSLIVADLEALSALAILTALALVLGLRKGAKRALLSAFQVFALSLVVLGVEIAVFDYKEFYLHVTQVQVSFSIAPWFSNADLLFSALGLFAVTTWMLHLQRPQSLR